MKKEIDITKIMDDYTDNEFGIEGEQAVDTEKAVSDLLAQVKPKKKRVKPLIKVLVAAVAVAVLAGAVTATTLIVQGGYRTPSGMTVSYEADENNSRVVVDVTNQVAPIKVEKGNRLFFTGHGQYIDITELVDENTPYIYSYENYEGDTCYVAVGGAAGDYGYLEIFPAGLDYWYADGHNINTPEEQHKPFPIGEFESAEECDRAIDEAERTYYKPWAIAACEELGFWASLSGFGGADKDSVAFNESIGYVYPNV